MGSEELVNAAKELNFIFVPWFFWVELEWGWQVFALILVVWLSDFSLNCAPLFSLLVLRLGYSAAAPRKIRVTLSFSKVNITPP